MLVLDMAVAYGSSILASTWFFIFNAAYRDDIDFYTEFNFEGAFLFF